MSWSDTQLGAVIALAAVLYFARLLTRYICRRQLAYNANCHDPPRYPQAPLRFGTDFARLQLQKQTKESYKDFLADLFRRYGRTFSVTVMGQPWVFTSDYENIRAINTSHAGSFVVEPLRKLPISEWIGDGIFASDGEAWKASRALFKPMFGRVAIGKQLGGFERHVARLIELIPEDGQEFDLQPLLKNLYLDVSTELMFGFSANSQVPEKALFDIEEFESSFERAMGGMFTRTFSSFVSFLASDDKDWRKACSNVHRVFDVCIDIALKESREEKLGSQTSKSMVAELALESEHRLFIRDQLLNVFIGARDTAGIGIADIFFHMARYPEVWTRVKAENRAIDSRTPITFELLKSLKYTQTVIAESLRLLSPVTISLRSASSDCVLPRGGGKDGSKPILITKGTKVEGSISSLHLDTSIWGEDADQFRPDRWDGLITKWDYIPFLGGARMCPAQQMMLTQYAYILLRFAQTFDSIENMDPVHEFVPQIIFSQQSKNGVKIAVKRAQQ